MDSEKEKIIQELRETGPGRKVDQELLARFPVKKTEELMIPARNGETHVFVYYPENNGTVLPLYINIHGGGFVKGHREQDVVFCRNIASRLNCVVADIDYVTAPEQKYPYALHQCYDAVKWFYQNPESEKLRVKIANKKIAVGGHSAGGNLTAALAIMSGQTGEFSTALQILDYAPVDMYSPPELKRNAYTNKGLSPGKCRLGQSLYIDPEQALEPYASPLFAPLEMLAGLPPALVITCGDDCFGEEAERYAFRLMEAGVAVTIKRFLESHHGFTIRRVDEFEAAERMIVNALEQSFNL
ncbi:MAG: alpha/beta hydrolase [Treponema sp.]|nr:alpha/beta hydrolase [Treponema sp.]